MAAKDLTDHRFGKLRVISRTDNDKHGNAMWRCLCECGNEAVVRGANLNSGQVQSCGCFMGKHVSHCDSTTRLYKIWYGIIRRTEDSKRKEYKDYGGRGIKMCAEWRESYEVFRDWAQQNGYEDNLSIDRIDNDGGYSPLNCRWTDKYKQANNRANSCVLSFDGVSKTTSEWSHELGVPYSRLKKRVRLGWSAERVLSE